MNITRLAIDNNRLTLVLFALIILGGIQVFNQMPRDYDPGFIVRAAQVVTYFPGASPERIEQLISSKIEDAAKEIPQLDFVSSESRTGVSVVVVNIKESYKDMRPIWDNLRRKIEDVESDLPSGAIGPFVNDEFGDVYGIVMTVTGEGMSYAELDNITENVKSQLQQLSEVAKIDIYGQQEERVYIEYNNSRLSELGLSSNQLSQILSARNIVLSGGSVNLGKETIALEPTGNFESLEDIGNTVIKSPKTEQLVLLRDIATIKRDYVDPPSSIVHSSGQRALALAISMRAGGNNILLGEMVTAKVAEFEQQYPIGVEFELVNFSPAEVDAKVKDFVNNLLQAVLVVTLVMLASLGIRTGIIVAVLIPTTMLLALIVMDQFSIGLDQISLAALIIALGMLVDNGIVMSENIMVQMEKGKSAIAAAIDSAGELRMPLLTASITTAAAFLPIFLAESAVGEFTASLFKVVTITLLCSWVISLTIIPMLCVQFMRVTPKETGFDSSIYTSYRKLLTWLLDHKAVTLGATLILFLGVMNAASLLPNIFFPPSDRTYYKIEVTMPTGNSLEDTKLVVEDLEAFIVTDLATNETREGGITTWVSYIGNAGPRFLLSHNPKPSTNNYALIVANVTDSELVGGLMTKLDDYVGETHPDMILRQKRIENGPAVENPVQVRLASENSETLFQAVEALRQYLQQMPELTNVSDNWGQQIKKLEIDIDQIRAQRAGLTSQDIALSLQTSLSGLELTEYREGEDSIPVLMRSESTIEENINQIRSLSVYSQSTGDAVPIRQVADVNLVWDLSVILRRDGVRTVTLGAQLAGDANAANVVAELDPWLKERQANEWGQGISFTYGGEAESSGKANQSIMDKMGVAGMIILIVLISQFNSVRKAGLVLMTIPLGLIGVILGLLIANSYIGFMTLLGIISLAGIVINNAIVLLERIQLELEAGLSQMDAIIESCLQRSRPILLTTATTVLGLIPLYLGGGAMWEPMSIAIMAGLLISTVFTLGVIPVLYAVFYGVNKPVVSD